MDLMRIIGIMAAVTGASFFNACRYLVSWILESMPGLGVAIQGLEP